MKPKFKYEPLKVTFRKRVALADLGKHEKKNLVKELLTVIWIAGMAGIGGVVILILMGVLKLFGVKEL